jgi:hypothetical protein
MKKLHVCISYLGNSMFPTSPLEGSVAIPSGATFWMPKAADIDEEGIGCFFRETWLIKDVPVGVARSLRRDERRIAEVVGELATTADDFDRLAHVIEDCADEEELNQRTDLSAAEREALRDLLPEVETGVLDSLEVGVAGLVYALATVRIIPAASCRGHVGRQVWSEAPVVLFAATEYRAKALQPLVEATQCRFTIDPARPDLLVVTGQSILRTMALADAILESRHTFVRSRPVRRVTPSNVGTQEQLF